MLAAFVHNNSVNEIFKQVNVIEISRLKLKETRLNNKIVENHRKLGNENGTYNPRTPNINLLCKVKDKRNYKKFTGTTDEETLKNDLEHVELLKKELNEYQKEIEKIERKINELQRPEHFLAINESLKEIEEKRKRVKEIQSILYIDDRASKGWKEVFSLVLFGKTDSSVFITINDNFYKSDRIIDAVIEKIKTNIPDIVFLDLKLLPKEENNPDIELLTSITLLKRIKRNYPGIPILIVSASNKVVSYETTIKKLGADGYWMKEGLDSIQNVNFSANNYNLLLGHVDCFNSKEYRLSRKIQDAIFKIERNQKPWWCNPTWVNKDQTEISKEEIVTRLKEIHSIYNLFLHNEASPLILLKNLIITASSTIIEKIHNISIFEGKSSSIIIGLEFGKKVLEENIFTKRRGDVISMLLYQYRNCASHNNDNNIGFYHFERFISVLLTWLVVDEFIDMTDTFTGIVSNKNKYDETKQSLKRLNELLLVMIFSNEIVSRTFKEISIIDFNQIDDSLLTINSSNFEI